MTPSVLFISLVIFANNPFSTAKEVTSAYKADVTITLAQSGKLNEFKSAVKGELSEEWMKTDLFLLKVLRSSNFDVHLGASNLRNILTWRKNNRMDEILSENFSDVQEFARYSDKLKDKFGQPVLYADAAASNIRRAIIQGKESRVRRYELYINEKFYRLILETGEKYGNVTRGISISNLAGFSLAENLCLRCIASLGQRVQGYESNYPEAFDKSILLSAPSFVLPIVQTARSFIRPENRDRIIVLGTNKKEQLDYLKTFMDENEIPIELGGKRELDI